MKIGIILNTNEAETCWNCFRFGNEALKNKGIILACGTCLKIREKDISICPISTIKDLLNLVEESDKVLTFG